MFRWHTRSTYTHTHTPLARERTHARVRSDSIRLLQTHARFVRSRCACGTCTLARTDSEASVSMAPETGHAMFQAASRTELRVFPASQSSPADSLSTTAAPLLLEAAVQPSSKEMPSCVPRLCSLVVESLGCSGRSAFSSLCRQLGFGGLAPGSRRLVLGASCPAHRRRRTARGAFGAWSFGEGSWEI